MKPLFPLCISLLAVAACAAQSPSPSFTEASPPIQVAVASPPLQPISSANTTSAYDGTYAGVAVEDVSAAGALAEGGDGLSGCVNYGVPPALTISNGLAQLQMHDVTFQGYVTPQGALTMRTGLGHKFVGQIDNQYDLKGQIMERCTYNLSWQRSTS